MKPQLVLVSIGALSASLLFRGLMHQICKVLCYIHSQYVRLSLRSSFKPFPEVSLKLPRMSRPRRNPSSTPTSMASISRDPLSSPAAQQALRFTVRLPASKLRQAIGESHPGQTVMVNSRDQFQGGEILDGKRSRNVKKSYIVESDSDEEDEEMEDVEEDADGDSIDDEDAIPEDDEDADADADGDVDMDIPPPRPQIKISRAVPSVISVKPSGKSDGKTVEQKEVSDDELSELDSEIEGEEGMQVSNEDDAEGEDEEIEVEDDEDSLDSDDDTPANGSRASTPDLTKLTKRQRARLEEGGSGHLLALPDGKTPFRTTGPWN